MVQAQFNWHERPWCKLPSTIDMWGNHNIAGGTEEIVFFDIIVFVWVFELDNNTGGIWELHLFDNVGFVWMFELDNITGVIGDLGFFDSIGIVLVSELDNITEVWAQTSVLIYG